MGIWECMCSAEWAAAQTICAFWMIFAGACNFLLWHRWAFALVSWWAIAVMICLYVYHGTLISIQCSALYSRMLCCVLVGRSTHVCIHVCTYVVPVSWLWLYTFIHVCMYATLCMYARPESWLWWYTIIHVCTYTAAVSWLWWYITHMCACMLGQSLGCDDICRREE